MDMRQIGSHIGSYIYRRRTELGLTLDDVAERAGTMKSRIWELEKGRAKNPTLKMALTLCEALECNLNSLLGIAVAHPEFTDQERALIAAHRRIFTARKG